jgi:LemA protein
MQIRINAAASNIEVQIKYRRDTLIKLVDATKSSVDYEKNLLTSLTQLRSKSFDFKDEAGRENIAALDKVGSKINAVMENYPKLQSVETIQQLMTTADYSEREIAASRRLYNANVQEFNSALYRFPTKIIAKIHNLYNFPLFSVNKQDMQDVSLNIA